MSEDVLVLGGGGPTPVEGFDVPNGRLWVKRDDLIAPVYGGNKVRKLERLFAAARRAGKSRIMTIGAAGSHQVVATALYGKREGFQVDAVLVPQPASEHARRNLRVALAHGLRPVLATSWGAAPAIAAAHLRGDIYFVPLGGSNALSSLGFVRAAHEVAAQVAAGTMPEPDRVVVATGSGGTAAGLAVGFEASGMRTRVVAVAISQPMRIVEMMTLRLAKKTAELAGLPRAGVVGAVKRIEIARDWLGRGYGHATPAGDAAQAAAARGGLVLDATYTAKAFACALSLARNDRETVLFWHTLSTAPLDALVAASPELPADVARLFR